MYMLVLAAAGALDLPKAVTPVKVPPISPLSRMLSAGATPHFPDSSAALKETLAHGDQV